MKLLHFAVFRVRWFRILLALLVLCLTSVLIQLGLPDNVSSSRARLGNIDIVSLDADEIERTLTALEDSSYVYIRADEELYISKFKDLGVSIDMQAARAEAEYDITDKIIPFSALWRWATAEKPITYTYNSEAARVLIEEVAAFAEELPEPAYLAAQEGQVAVVPDVPGSFIDVDQALEKIGGVEYIDRIEVQLEQSESRAELTTEIALEYADEANALIAEAPSLINDQDEKVFIPEADMATWFQVIESGDEFELVVNEERVSEYLDEVSSQLLRPASKTVVTLLDGNEITRVNGVDGKVVDKVKALEDIKQALFTDEPMEEIQLGFQDVEAGVTYTSTYSNSSGGLAKFLEDLLRSRGNYAVSVTHLEKPEIRASYRGNEVFIAASTYKVYVAYYVASQVEAGVFSWNTVLPSGRQVDYCYDQMIEVSSNSCAAELRNFVGADNINNALRALGMPTAGFTNNAITSANELTLFMELLYSGRLMNEENTQHLIDLMVRQIHRKAIPTGVYPIKVADKGGFVYGYNHDTGIVYADTGAYAITVLSRGGYSKANLAAVARDVHNFVKTL